MCIAPLALADGTMTACHECWQCRERAINDWVGRNIAESKTAVAAHAVTLTYGDGDHPAAAILTYSDVQKYIKRLRRAGYPLRYFAIGEYGSAKGRAHWHLMIYWLAKAPPVKLRSSTYIDQFWTAGYSYWDNPSHQAIRYNCKYIAKDIGKDERQGHLAMSKKPPLGTAYFQRLAEQYVENELAPQTLEYSFAEVTRTSQGAPEGERVKFMLKDRPAELFLEHYVKTWAARFPRRHMPQSDLVDEYLDTLADVELLLGKWAYEDALRRAAAWRPEPVRRGAHDLGEWIEEMRERDNGT